MMTSNAVQMTNKEFFRQREVLALRRIPGVSELLRATADQRPALEKKYPDAVFALQIISNPFIKNREVGAIQMEAYYRMRTPLQPLPRKKEKPRKGTRRWRAQQQKEKKLAKRAAIRNVYALLEAI